MNLMNLFNQIKMLFGLMKENESVFNGHYESEISPNLSDIKSNKYAELVLNENIDENQEQTQISNNKTDIPNLIEINNISAAINITDYIQPTDDEIEECFAQVAFFSRDYKENKYERSGEPVERIFQKICEKCQDFTIYKDHSTVMSDKLAKEIRGKIKLLIHQNKPIDDYVEALIYSIYVKDFLKEIALRCNFNDDKVQIIPSSGLISKKVYSHILNLKLDFNDVGYSLFPSFSKTDIKWIKTVYKEPKSHLSPAVLIKDIKRNAVVDFYKKKRRYNPTYYKSKDPEIDGIEWSLKLDIESSLGFHKGWLERIGRRTLDKQASNLYVKNAIMATKGQYIIADLETTGLNPNEDEITEFGALLCDELGNALARFEAIVKINVKIPKEVIKITGITDELIETFGRSLDDVFLEFVSFVGSRPIFFHNAKFDTDFLKVASQKTGIALDNEVFDTLTLARSQWRGLRGYSLAALSNQLGICPPTHRAMGDIITTHKILLKIIEDHAQANIQN